MDSGCRGNPIEFGGEGSYASSHVHLEGSLELLPARLARKTGEHQLPNWFAKLFSPMPPFDQISRLLTDWAQYNTSPR